MHVVTWIFFRNTAQVSGGERELRATYLKPFNRACLESLSIMTAYSSYDGIPAIANTRECRGESSRSIMIADISAADLLTDIVCQLDVFMISER